MKQMQGIGVRPDFSLGVPAQLETTTLNRWLKRMKNRLVHLAANRRELLFSAAATMGVSLGMLLISYLFLVQLAAYGW